MSVLSQISGEIIMLVAIAFGLYLGILDLRGRLSRLDAKLDLLMQHAGIDLLKDIPRDVIDAMQQGKKIQAIMLYRRATGASLQEAKYFVEVELGRLLARRS